MTDLDAIRARAEQYPEPPERADDLDLPWLLWGAADRRTLLAEVDALNEVVLALQQTVEREGAEVDRLSRKPDVLRELDLLGRATRAEAELAAERARIRAEVLKLRASVLQGKNDTWASIHRGDVFAAIDGAVIVVEPTDCQHRTWLTMDPPVCAGCGMVGDR